VAVSVLFDLARELNKAKETDINRSHCLSYTLIQLAGLLGLLQDDPERFLKSGVIDNADITDDFVEQQIRARLEAKQAKNWLLADEIRDALKGQGVILEDAPNGLTSWRRE
jgi:cysteinyl-tRNA synthetase